ncbi:MAG: FAD binding domain-containing protein [bacterium]
MIDFNVISPETVEELLNEIEKHLDNGFRFGAGFTDLLMEFKKLSGEPVTVINLANIKDSLFKEIAVNNDFIKIGSLVTASEIVTNKDIIELFPVLHKAAETLASKQIRQVATIGGNVCTASPAGDMSTALVALNAVCEVLSSENKLRDVQIRDFFKGVRKTDLHKNEILRSINIPLTTDFNKIISDYIKIGIRKSMECSVISLAYHLYLNKDNTITKAGIAIGSAAPTIMFTESACEYLVGKNLKELSYTAMETFAEKVMEYASPISDIRGSEWYRKQVLLNISKNLSFKY